MKLRVILLCCAGVSMNLATQALTNDCYAGVVSESLTFAGSPQTLNFSAAINGGYLAASGSGTFGGAPLLLNPNPQTVNLQFNPNPSNFATHPTASAATIQVDNQTGQVQSLSGLSLDLFGGGVETTTLHEAEIGTTIGGFPTLLPLDATFSFSDFGFDSLSGSVTGNHFSFTGVGTGLLDVTVTLGGVQVYHSFGAFGVTPPVTVTGTISTTPGPTPHSENIILDGTGSVTTLVSDPTNPLFVSDLPLISFSGTSSVYIPFDFTGAFHLEADPANVIVPEPAALFLFLTGSSLLFRFRRKLR